MTGNGCSLVLPPDMARDLHRHLFPGDRDEHGAVILAGVARSDRGLRLLARELHLAEDGVDYVPGRRGYRMLRGEFVRDKILRARDERLGYLAIHNHGGDDSVGFSEPDLQSHERGYPALLDIAEGQPVGALVVAHNAIAGDIWTSADQRHVLRETRVLGPDLRRLYPAPPPPPPGRREQYDRQARLFGDAGQDLLGRAKVGVIGAGGAGSLIIEYLARLGVGWLVVADPDRLDITNLPRVVDATRFDARSWLTDPTRPRWARKLGARVAATKIAIARRVARRANPRIRFESLYGSIVDPDVAGHLVDCDYLFLAADTMQARLVFNAMVYQYAIPGVQVGAKVRVDPESGEVLDVFSVSRPVTLAGGCLWCNGLISPAGLQREAASPDERVAQRYVDDPNVSAPSVITLNAVAAAHATNDFMFAFTGLTNADANSSDYAYFLPRSRSVRYEIPYVDPACTECGNCPDSRRARGDAVALPLREAGAGR